MPRTSAGPQPAPSTRPAGALSRAQQPAPPGAMRSGAWNDNSPNRSADDPYQSSQGTTASTVIDEQESRGRQPRQSDEHYDDGTEAIGPLPNTSNRRDSPMGDSGERSNSRESGFARRLSAGLGNVLRGRSASRERESKTLSRQNTDASTLLEAERGRDRGREPPVSTGRGGAGNVIRSPSRGRPAEEAGETAAQREYAEKQTVVSSGRGGAGNVRSPSRGPADRARAAELERQEREIQAAALKKDEASPHTTGRGGAGNIKKDHAYESRGREQGGVGSAIRSMSRSRSREPRSSSAQRDPNNHNPHGSSPLAVVDEKSSVSGASTTSATNEPHHQGIFGKIASHLPGHSSHGANGTS